MAQKPSAEAANDSGSAPSSRLDSWKDVAAYLKRDVSTVQRWERREGLPIHRHLHDRLGSIYAYRHELDAWQRGRARQVFVESGTPAPTAPFPTTPSGAPRSRVGWALLVGGLVVSVLILLGIGLVPDRATPRARPDISSLAVLPLATFSADPSQAYVAAGLTEALTTRLAGLRALRVVSTTSALAFEGRRVPLPTIGQELSVDAVLEGSVLHQGGRVKISIRLIHAPTDTPLWTRDFEADAADLLRLESDVARAVADEMRVQIMPDEQARLASVAAVNPQAHEEYLLGRYLLWKFIEEDRLQAIEHFQRAIRIAPDYAPPYAGLAHAWWIGGVMGPLSLKEVAAPAREAAREALARDHRLPEAYASQAYVQGMFDWDWAGAEATIERATVLAHNSVDVHYVHALLLMAMGRLGDATRQIDRAAQLDPLSAQVQSTFGRILYRARRFDEAAARLDRAITLEPRNAASRGRLADVYEQLGRHEDALKTYEEARALISSPTEYQSRIARTYARMGRTEDARRLLGTMRSPAAAVVHVALGDRDAAFRALFRAIDTREDWLLFIKADPDFDAIHTDPRWQVLLRRMNLEND